MNPTGSLSSLRLVHVSDIHVTARRLGWRRRDWLSKRLTGWLHLKVMGRARRFRRAEEVLTAWMGELRARPPDHIIFSGDATSLGFEAEFARAATLLGVAGAERWPGLAVPGNHDYYTRSAAAEKLFERYFAPWQVGEHVDGAPYPFAQRVGPIWLIGVNSSRGNRLAWDSGGGVGEAQLERLERLLGGLSPGPRILVTHYPYCLATGRREGRTRRLRDRDRLLEVAERGKICLWLHGHHHDSFIIDDPRHAPIPIICSGSATQRGRWSYGEYTLTAGQLHIVRRVYVPESGGFQSAESLGLQLPEYPL